jgi:hypothetical protein
VDNAIFVLSFPFFNLLADNLPVFFRPFLMNPPLLEVPFVLGFAGLFSASFCQTKFDCISAYLAKN